MRPVLITTVTFLTLLGIGCGRSWKWETYTSTSHRYSIELPGKAVPEPGSSAEAELVMVFLDKDHGVAVRAERMALPAGKTVSTSKAKSVLEAAVKGLSKTVD